MDTFVDSSWYYLRFACADAQAMVDERADYWLPVDQYIGGIEHAILHLLYSRFWTKLMRDLGLVKIDEPFAQPADPGHGAATTSTRASTRRGSASSTSIPADVDVQLERNGAQVGAKLHRRRPAGASADGIGTMSKSKNNGVDPQTMVERYGADTVRLFMMFTAPPEDTLEWTDAGVEGTARFLRRLWRMVWEHLEKGRPAKGPLQELVALSPSQRRDPSHGARDARESDGRLRPPPRVQHCDCRGDGAHECASRNSTIRANRVAPCAMRRWS